MFVVISCIYLFCVGATFLFGLLTKNDAGASFLPVLLLTFPWTYVFVYVAGPLGLVPVMTAYYDLPLFAISAFMNVGIAEALRRVRAKASEGFVRIAPQ